jgi:hypothetical protein
VITINSISIVGAVDASAEQAPLAADTQYAYCSDVASVVRLTTLGGQDAASTPATGDSLVPAGETRIVRRSNGSTHLSIIRRSTDGVYTLSVI